VIDLKEKLHEIAPDIFKGTPVMFAYLYGSYAGGVPHRFSDFDFLPVIQEYQKTYRDNALSAGKYFPCTMCRVP